MLKLRTHAARETRAFGERLAPYLSEGAIVALSGELAAGKTTMIQGICTGLAVDGGVESPTFTLVNEYRGRRPVYHIDCYREQRLDEWLELGIYEYLYGNGVTLIEWAERIEPLLPEHTIHIRISHLMTDEEGREIELWGCPELEKNLKKSVVIER